MAKGAIEISVDSSSAIAFLGDAHCDIITPECRIDNMMDTVISKLESILEICIDNNVKALFCTGDVFSRIGVPHECVNEVGNTFMKFKRAGIKVLTILGNHDVPRNQLEKIMKSPISTLFTFESAIHISLNNRVIINKRTLITPSGYLEELVPAYEKAKHNILIAHRFFNGSDLIASPKDNITKDQVDELGYDCMVLGHDHVEYPIVKYGKTDIVRPGGMIRGTSHEYNFDRIPCFYVLKNPGEYDVRNFEKFSIKALPFESVASNTVINKKNMSTSGGLKLILADLAGKIASIDSDRCDEDRFVTIVRNDENLPDDIRRILLDLFSEFGITA